MSIIPESAAESGAAVPPPGCPAHAGGAGLTALYGPQAQSDPHGLYEKLRAEHGTVAPVQLEGGVPAWLVLGYRENTEAARSATKFTRDSRTWRGWEEKQIGDDSPLIPILGWRPDVMSVDGEEHQRLRSAVNDCLARFDRHGIRRHVQRYANQLIDAFIESGRADLVEEFADHLPMLVFARLIGLTEDQGPKLLEASVGIVKGGEKAVEYNNYIIGTLRTLTEERRKVPAHDLATWMVQHESGLSDDEVLNHLRMILVAGNETTTSLISSTLRMILTDPRFRASLTGGLMTLPDAVEQMLWDEPPLMVCPARFATHDMQFGGQEIKEGDLLVLGFAAGNMDPEIRPDLDAPMHGNRSHLAFSRGPHECPGQDIGRAITDTGVDVLLSRLPDLQLAVPEEQLSWSSGTWSRHLDVLPVQFAPQRRSEPEQAAAVPAPRTVSQQPVSTPAGGSPGTAAGSAATASAPPLSAAADALAAIAQADAAADAEDRDRRGFWSSLAGIFRRRR
ncbi:cytochrome P450 [Actinospica sp.]|uniref:cytochrome P450 n=1 Tax=Actinospica sp. TaxID=1872142 RepID=UPI002BC07EDF|nr:cytochrome P450 [Actinospica sp.]HWG25257.1 cytochrome P450 [Actinospica sp.]